MIFDFNHWNKALEILNFSKEAKDDLLQKYNGLMVAKMAKLASLTEETDQTELLAKLGEKAKNDPEFLKKVEEYIKSLNLEFIDTFAKIATPEQKTELIAYFDEYEKQLNNLSQQ